MADAGYKRCSVCGLDRAIINFLADARASDGLQPSCRECVNARRRERRLADHDRIRERERAYYLANKEKVHLRNAESRARHPDRVKEGKKAWYERVKNDPEFQAKAKAHREANKAAKQAYDREYRRRHPGEALERARNWVKANPEKRAAITRNYSIRRRRAVRGGVSTAALAAWTVAQKKICYWCGARCPEGFHIDHYKPLSKGGEHELHNLVIACGPCNLKKNAKDPLDFAKEVGRLF